MRRIGPSIRRMVGMVVMAATGLLGCPASQQGVRTERPTPAVERQIAFGRDSNVGKLYQALKNAGVRDSDLDQGYFEADYVNRKRYFKGKNDKVIQAEEVLDYALERYVRFQLAIKKHMGYVIPWALDDFDPNTTFDQEIRTKIKAKITFFKKEMKKAGYLDPSVDKYKELLAVSIFAYVLTSKKGAAVLRAPAEALKELRNAKLASIADLILKEGGVGLADFKRDCDPEATALEALKQNCGMCTELNYITFAALKMGGLEALSLHVEAPKTYLKKMGWPPSTHASLMLALKNKKRIIDPGLGIADAESYYRENSFKWIQLPFRGWLGSYYALYASHFHKKSEDKIVLGAYKKAGELNNPQSYAININLGGIYLKKGELDGAIGCYKKALALKPGSTDAMRMLAFAYHKKKQFDKAVKLYKKLLAIKSEYANALNNLASVYLERKQYDKALKVCRRIAALEPKNWKIRKIIGQIHAIKNEYDRAIKEYKKILKENPAYLSVYIGLWVALFNQAGGLMMEGKYKDAFVKFDEAKKVLQDYLGRKPGDKQALKMIQRIKSAQKQLKKHNPDIK